MTRSLSPDVRRRLLPWRQLVGHQHGPAVPVRAPALDAQRADPVLVLQGVPTAGPQVHIAFKEVQSGINRLLLDAKEPGATR